MDVQRGVTAALHPKQTTGTSHQNSSVHHWFLTSTPTRDQSPITGHRDPGL